MKESQMSKSDYAWLKRQIVGMEANILTMFQDANKSIRELRERVEALERIVGKLDERLAAIENTSNSEDYKDNIDMELGL